MQRNKTGIPVNVGRGYNPKRKSRIEKLKSYTQNKFKDFVELSGITNGLVEHRQIPKNTKEHLQAINEGFVVVREWSVE